MQDVALLRRYSESGSEDAFAALVKGCLPLVYGAALRRVGGDVHLAGDVTQMVFTAVARDAARLARHPNLAGWLFTTTRFLATKVMRSEHRRHVRETAAWLEQSDETVGESPVRLQLVLDDVLMELQQLDRDMLVMRFYRGLRLVEIGAQLNSSENAVQKRIERALERLKLALTKRGITSTAAAIAFVLESHGAIAVPTGLAAAATTAGVACGAGTGAGLGVSSAVAASKLPLAVAAAIAVVSSAGFVWHYGENARLRAELTAAASSPRAQERPIETAPSSVAQSSPVSPPRSMVPEATLPSPAAPIPSVSQPPVRATATARPVVRGGSVAAGRMVPLEIDYPKPLFAGTPRPISVANLEPPIRGPLPVPMMVPIATTLLSRGKPVTSSDPLPVIGELSMVTDGDKRGIAGTSIELGPGLQWIQIDLGASMRIQAIAVWHFHSQARVYHDVVVQISDDANFKREVTTLFNNDHDNSAKLGKGKDRAYVETSRGRVIDGFGTAARYVRLYSNGNSSDELNHYCEVEVFGEPAK